MQNRVISAARGWLGTPYHPGGRVKGAGVDCLTLLAEVYAEAGILPRVHVPTYSPDWHLHRNSERYMDGLLDYAVEVIPPPMPGDIALWKFGRCYSHGAIVVAWPRIIHASVGRPCTEENAMAAEWLSQLPNGKPRPVRFFRVS